MAIIAADRIIAARSDDRFFMRAAIVMTALIFVGFSTQLAAGRSTFASPLLVHTHAIIFMGWVVLNLLQTFFATSGRMRLHRTLGWIGAGWVVLMIVVGCAVVVVMLRRGQVPFFFRPQQFLIFDPLSLFAFAALTAAAIKLRRRTDWHKRLHFCAMSLLLGPAFGRLMPMPLLAPLAYEATFLATLLFPIAGIVADIRRSGSVHSAWKWGIGTMLTTAVLIEVLTYSAVGGAIYRGVTAGSPGASVAGLEFPPPPEGPLITGRGEAQ